MERQISTFNGLQQQLADLEHQSMVLQNMKKQGNRDKVTLKKRYALLSSSELSKKEGSRKIESYIHAKKGVLHKIETDLYREKTCEIPEQLAEELEKKMN